MVTEVWSVVKRAARRKSAGNELEHLASASRWAAALALACVGLKVAFSVSR